MKHTPGPWKLLRTARPSQWLVVAGDDTMDRHNGNSFSIQFNEANARLIAAAPEMLEALQKARDAIAGSDDGDREFILPTIDAAIAKAIQS